MNETAFYVLGIALVVVALVVSFVGLRFEKFPTTRGLLIGGTLAIAVLVGATMTFAWRNAEDEQAHREAELAEDVAENEEAGDTAEADEEAGSDRRGATAGGHDGLGRWSPGVRGAGLRRLSHARRRGLDRDHGPGPRRRARRASRRRSSRSRSSTRTKEIAEGYPPDVMPQTFADLPPEQLDALVAYLSESTGGQ